MAYEDAPNDGFKGEAAVSGAMQASFYSFYF